MKNTIRSHRLMAAMVAAGLLAGCASGSDLAANAYSSDQVNTAQKAETVKILAVMPAKVKVTNKQEQRDAQLVGGLLGAILGGNTSKSNNQKRVQGAIVGGAAGAITGTLVPGQVLVSGVSITYLYHKQTYNSVEVGNICQYQPGMAVMVSSKANETRIQPNAVCPPTKKS